MQTRLAAPSRRAAMGAAGLAALAALLTPRLAFADPAAVAAELKKLFGDKTFAAGKIKLDIPEIAENGFVVPVTVDVESPMTDADYVKAVHIFAEENPQPTVVTWRFTPACGKASASTRMRLAKSQTVVCIAEMSDGSLYSAKAQVKVTVGGCGG
jgi:sulfur-oxidizing protein SoxY